MKKPEGILNGSKAWHLWNIVSFIRQELPQTEMIILYGSYARGDYVHLDFREEFGIPTFFRSDFDILVVTHGISKDNIYRKMHSIRKLYIESAKFKPPLQIIHEDIHNLNECLSDGRYFYDQLKREGIMLYDSGRFKLARKRTLTYEEIKQQAEEYFEKHYQWGCNILKMVEHFHDDKDSILTPYHLHQACESFYYAIRLVHTLKNSKQHDLSYLAASVRKYSPDFQKVFPRDTKEEKRLFKLLRAGYVEARYNPRFKVNREDINALLIKVKMLKEVTEKVCLERIKEYDNKICNISIRA